jgi:tellurite resistance protein TerC
VLAVPFTGDGGWYENREESVIDFAAVMIVIQLVFLESILSIDNAAVLGAMVAHLPNDKPTPWPHRLRPLFSKLDPALGSQREAALKVGLLGAYGGRALMLALASVIIQLPWAHILGAMYLLYLGIAHFGGRYRRGQEDEYGEPVVQRRGGFWSVVLAIELADLAFSIDNVVAAVALSRELWLVLLGVAIGMLAMRFAATLFTRMIAWEPALEDGAYLLLLFIGGKFLLESWLHWHVDEYLQFGISVLLLLLAVLFGRVRRLKSLLIIFLPFIIIFAVVQAGVGLILSGLTLPVRRRLPAKEEDEVSESESAA